jgi:pyrroloquinoline quinone (PQQ) biosynthesis protein C
MMTNAQFPELVHKTISTAVEQMEFFWKVIEGKASSEELTIAAKEYYAEVRTFLDIKLPHRMRICPIEALDVRKFLCEIYEEEHGNFEVGRDHAALWKKFCNALGLADSELERHYHQYAAGFSYMSEIEPSVDNMVTEIAIMTAWESVGPLFARLPLESLRTHYDLSPDALEFFELHSVVDVEHSSQALELLTRYASTPVLRERAIAAMTETLKLDNYIPAVA